MPGDFQAQQKQHEEEECQIAKIPLFWDPWTFCDQMYQKNGFKR